MLSRLVACGSDPDPGSHLQRVEHSTADARSRTSARWPVPSTSRPSSPCVELGEGGHPPGRERSVRGPEVRPGSADGRPGRTVATDEEMPEPLPPAAGTGLQLHVPEPVDWRRPRCGPPAPARVSGPASGAVVRSTGRGRRHRRPATRGRGRARAAAGSPPRTRWAAAGAKTSRPSNVGPGSPGSGAGHRGRQRSQGPSRSMATAESTPP